MDAVESYYRDQGLWHDAGQPEASYSFLYIRRGQREDTRFVKTASYAGEGDMAGRNEFRIGGRVNRTMCSRKKITYYHRYTGQLSVNYNWIRSGKS